MFGFEVKHSVNSIQWFILLDLSHTFCLIYVSLWNFTSFPSTNRELCA